MNTCSHIRPLFLICFFTLVMPAATRHAAGNTPHADSKPPGLQLAIFDIDVSPPEGYEMAFTPMIRPWDLGLRARGVVLSGAGKPVVLLAVDWIGIGNRSMDAFKTSLAGAAGTVPQRVAVHTVHQHDAPEGNIKSRFVRQVVKRLETAVRESLEESRPVTHIGIGQAEVYKVASNRRILGPDGKVRAMRYTSCRDSALRAEPEGVIDPMMSLISFWNADTVLTVLSYYATHPQSYYKTGMANPDFPGVARFLRQLAVPDALHVHFTGAGGNIGAGKYNDGSHENRGILAERLADGMRRAWETTVREPIHAGLVDWTVEPVALPPDTAKNNHADRLKSYAKRFNAGKQIDVQCLTLGRARILHLPGELFVEYQLAAKAMRPDLFVAVAAYGDYGPWYIPTAIAFEQGGYEASASLVTPEAEELLIAVILKLLKAQPLVYGERGGTENH